MGNLPKVTVGFSNGNLLKDIAAIDGIAGLLVTVDTVGYIGVVKTVYSLADAVSQGFTEADEPFAYKHISEFYAEVGGNQKLYIMGTAETMSMAQALDHSDVDAGIKLCQAAQGEIRLLGVMRKPDAGYDAGNAFFDADVEAAVIAGKAFAAAELVAQRPLRILIEGRVNDEASADVFQPKTSAAGACGVVLGGSVNDGTASVGLALGRLCKYPAEVKIGKVANGPLTLTAAYIGTKLVKDVAALDTLHGNGCISFMQHPQKAGYYFGVDRMASTDDYKLLAYGRVVDKAAVIAFGTYVEDLEGEVELVDGKISDEDAKHLEGRLEQQINVLMANQISAVSVYVNPDQNIITTSTLNVVVRILPKGYTTYITVDLGLRAS